jgi:hypothetical protein
MISSNFMDIFGGRLGSSGMCGMLERPLGANILLLDVSFSLEGASTSLEGDFTFFYSSIRVLI